MRSDIIYEKISDLSDRVVNKNQNTKKQEFEEGHEGYIWTLLNWSDDMLISGGRDKLIKVWNKNGQCIQRVKGHENSIFDMIKFDD